jgi:hypothetical protein
MTQYVLSTMTNSISYAFWAKTGDVPTIRQKITIKGGAGLPSLRSGFGEMTKDGEGIPIWTADGIVTPISDEQWDVLKDHPIFVKHQTQGFVKVINRDITGNHREVQKQIATMEKRDGFAQLNKNTIGDHTKVKISQDSLDADVQFRN